MPPLITQTKEYFKARVHMFNHNAHGSQIAVCTPLTLVRYAYRGNKCGFTDITLVSKNEFVGEKPLKHTRSTAQGNIVHTAGNTASNPNDSPSYDRDYNFIVDGVPFLATIVVESLVYFIGRPFDGTDGAVDYAVHNPRRIHKATFKIDLFFVQFNIGKYAKAGSTCATPATLTTSRPASSRRITCQT